MSQAVFITRSIVCAACGFAIHWDNKQTSFMHGQGDITNIKRSHFVMRLIYIDEEIGCRKYVPTSMLSFVYLSQKAIKRYEKKTVLENTTQYGQYTCSYVTQTKRV